MDIAKYLTNRSQEGRIMSDEDRQIVVDALQELAADLWIDDRTEALCDIKEANLTGWIGLNLMTDDDLLDEVKVVIEEVEDENAGEDTLTQIYLKYRPDPASVPPVLDTSTSSVVQ